MNYTIRRQTLNGKSVYYVADESGACVSPHFHTLEQVDNYIHRNARQNGEEIKSKVVTVARKKGFFNKLLRAAGRVPLAVEIVAMYFAMLDEQTPFPVKSSIAVALLYWLSPLDIIPGIPVDDIMGIGGALALSAAYIRPEHIASARKVLGRAV